MVSGLVGALLAVPFSDATSHQGRGKHRPYAIPMDLSPWAMGQSLKKDGINAC